MTSDARAIIGKLVGQLGKRVGEGLGTMVCGVVADSFEESPASWRP